MSVMEGHPQLIQGGDATSAPSRDLLLPPFLQQQQQMISPLNFSSEENPEVTLQSLPSSESMITAERNPEVTLRSLPSSELMITAERFQGYPFRAKGQAIAEISYQQGHANGPNTLTPSRQTKLKRPRMDFQQQQTRSIKQSQLSFSAMPHLYSSNEGNSVAPMQCFSPLDSTINPTTQNFEVYQRRAPIKKSIPVTIHKAATPSQQCRLKRSLIESQRQQQMRYVKQRWAQASSFYLTSLKISDGMILTTTTTGQCFTISICEIPSLPPEVVKSMLSLIISSISYSPTSSSLASDNSSRQNVETVINPRENKEPSTTEWNEWIEDLNNQLLSSPPPSPKKLVPPPPTRKKQVSPSSSTTSLTICSSPIIILLSRKLLLDTAAAIDEGEKETAMAYLDILRRTRNPHGTVTQRLTAMMILALSERIKPTRRPIADLCSSEQKSAIDILCSISPLFQLSLMAANHAIVEATLDDTIIHILDFFPGKGSQLANIINLLAGHHKSPLVIKITIVCNPTSVISRLNNGEGGNMLENVQQRLVRVVERLEGVKLYAAKLSVSLDHSSGTEYAIFMGPPVKFCLVLHSTLQLLLIFKINVTEAT